jgi:hypothetical protein
MGRKLLHAAFAAVWVEATGALVTGRAKQATYADGVGGGWALYLADAWQYAR